MSQKTDFEQKEQAITDPLPDFIPIWTEIHDLIKDINDEYNRIIKSRVLSSEREVSYTNGCTCLVGEGHGFKSNCWYDGCEKCNILSGSSAQDALYGTDIQFYAFKQELYDHIQSEHKQ